MLISNWNMINNFDSNLGTATISVFVMQLKYCIKFTKFVYIFFLLFDP